MALFTNLHHVGDVLVSLLTDHLSSAPTIQVGPPLESGTSVTEEIRITLLWVTPQPSHRNDRVESDTFGRQLRPPITLSAFFLVTTYGSTTAEDPSGALQLLGNAIQVFHTFPEIALSGTSDYPGEGRLTFIEIPTTAELMEHVYTPLQVKHRSWVIFEVGPVQLASLTPPAPAGAQVRPDGLRLMGPGPLNQPVLSRLTPQRQAASGVLRLDVDLRGQTLEGVQVGKTLVSPVDLVELTPHSAYLLTLPSETKADQTLAIRLRTGPQVTFSNTLQLGVISAQIPSIDAPPTLSASARLVYTGRGLSGAIGILVWPDGGLASPSQVTTLPVTNVTATSVESLAAPGVPPGKYRSAVRFPNGSFTPFILLELTS